jgi:uncharacterized membrane protein
MWLDQRTRIVAELGPVELLLVQFPGNQFTGEIAPALQNLVDSGTIRIIDLVFVAKDADGNAVGVEIEDLNDESRANYNALVDELEGLISEDDIDDLAAALEPNSSAGILLFEHTWATPFRDALVNSGGELLARFPIPPEAMAEVIAANNAAG